MDLAPEANVIGALALALSDSLLNAAEATAPELGPAAPALVLIGHETDLSINDLRAGVGLSHPGAVRLVDRLAAAGLVTRAPGREDRRAVALALTSAGAATVAAITAARNEALTRALAALDSDERDLLAALSAKLLRAMLRGEDHASEICRLCDFERCADCPVGEELALRAGAA